MTRSPPIKAKRPRLRWYLQVARLHLARLWLLPGRELLSRAFALLAGIALLGTLFAYGDLSVEQAQVVDGVEVHVAWINFVIQLVIMIVSALISYALAPKPKDAEVAKANVPVAEEGKGIERVYGTVWFEDPYMLGFKQLGTIPIKAKGGKK
jgi:hypothetical protein